MGDYQYLYDSLERHRKARIDERVHPNDSMYDPAYFAHGRSAVHAIATAYLASRLTEVNRLLDLPCGYGRVTRHLVHLFPDAEIDACDIDGNGPRFCAETFGVHPIVSREDPRELELPHEYDIIWVGSLLTHTDRQQGIAWLKRLSSSLAPSGVIVATTHGRFCERVHEVAPYIGAEPWAQILAGYRETGFGFADYPGDQKSPGIQKSYGISLARPSVMVSDLEAIPGTRVVLYTERGWGDHQDVVVIGKPDIAQPWSAMSAKAADDGE